MSTLIASLLISCAPRTFTATVVAAQKAKTQFVTVKMDRPLGSAHPKHGFIYTVNYGFIPNTISGDGEELDVYLLGVDIPVKTYRATVNVSFYTIDSISKSCCLVLRKIKHCKCISCSSLTSNTR